MNTNTADWMEDVMADAAWSRRLAGALLGDPDAAHDAAQDAWIRTTAGAEPAPERPRGWMRAVVGNALRDRRRGERRRRAREEAAEIGPTPALSQEELLGRLEVREILVATIATLPDPAQKVVLLHYFEGLPLVDVAAVLGAPEGTVRWRLKTALDELRRRLERRYGDERRDWRRALLPLLAADGEGLAQTAQSARAGGPGAALRRHVRAGLTASAAAVAMGVGLFQVSALASRPGLDVAELGAGAGRPPGARTLAAAASTLSRPGAGSPAPRVAALQIPCDAEISARTRELEAAREALDHHLSPEAIWADARDGHNPAARAALDPLVSRALDERGAPAAGRSFECRATVCRAIVEEPWPVSAAWARRAPTDATARALDARAHGARLVGPERKTRPVGVSPYAETTLWLRLNARSGAAAPAASPPLPPTLLPSARALASTPAERAGAEACGGKLLELDKELAALRRKATKGVPGAILHRHEPADAALTAKIDREIAEAVARQAVATKNGPRSPRPFADCRGLVCALAPANGERVPANLVKQIVGDLALTNEINRVDFEMRDGHLERAGYVVLRPLPPGVRDGASVLRLFGNQIQNSKVLDDCRQNFAGTGAVTVQLVLPAAGEKNADGAEGRISASSSGPGLETPLGRCVQERFARAAASFEVPSGVTRAESSKTFDLPRGL